MVADADESIAEFTSRYRNIIIASNRGPIEFGINEEHQIEAYPSTGGMVSLIGETAQRLDATWVALALSKGDRQALVHCGNGDYLDDAYAGPHKRLRFVLAPAGAVRKHYEIFSNRMLWFFLHYMYHPTHGFVDDAEMIDAWTHGYRVTNRAIARAVVDEIQKSHGQTAVLIQDYLLGLVAEEVRRYQPAVVIQQFIHCPWPDARYWELLPMQILRPLYTSLLANDVVAFQTERDAENFVRSAASVLEDVRVDPSNGDVGNVGNVWFAGRQTRVRAYPASISVVKERLLATGAATTESVQSLRNLFAKKVILRVDRIDPMKNIARGFVAYDRLLEEHPELRGEVVFLALLVPVRDMISTYRDYQREVDRVIRAINDKYGTADWLPIHVVYGNDRPRALWALQAYDVLLVNPILDGMNLVCKEGVALNKRDGALILSRTAGAFVEMGEACLAVAPMSIEETAESLYQALTMPADFRRARAGRMRAIVETNDLTRWLSRQAHELNDLFPCTF
jgi:trehalose 6-phosphate synthase